MLLHCPPHVTIGTILAFIQARMGSRRFPGKVLAPFRGEPIIAHVIRAVSHSVPPDRIVVVTSRERADDPLVAYLGTLNVTSFRGPLDDVFERFRLAAREFPCEWVLRICADSPLLDPAVVRRVLEAASAELDLVTTVFPRSFPRGHSAELIRTATLLAVEPSELTDEDREHVTPFFYRHPERFAIRSIESGDADLASQSLVVDTIKDLQRLERPSGGGRPGASPETASS